MIKRFVIVILSTAIIIFASYYIGIVVNAIRDFGIPNDAVFALIGYGMLWLVFLILIGGGILLLVYDMIIAPIVNHIVGKDILPTMGEGDISDGSSME